MRVGAEEAPFGFGMEVKVVLYTLWGPGRVAWRGFGGAEVSVKCPGCRRTSLRDLVPAASAAASWPGSAAGS